MLRAILLSVLLCLVVPAVVAPARAAAADKILDTTIDRYMEEAARWEPRIKQAAKTMFWILATISMVFTFAFMFAKGNTSLGDFFGEFLRFIVTVGFFYWLLDNGSAIAKAIIKSFGQLGLEASSTYQADLSPSNLVSFGLELIGGACLTFGEQDYATSIVILLLSLAIAVLFGIIAAMMVQLLCTAWVLVYAGTVVLGFGGGRWTQDIAINYFKTVLGLALQTFTFCLLVGIGQQTVEGLIARAHQAKNVVVKGYVYDSTINTTSMTITEACVILLFTVILFMLVKTVPNMVAGIISGSSTGGIGLGGGGAAVAGAAALASGGAMIAMQAAGAGMALSSAYQQTKENMANNAGLFKGGGGGGGMGGGLAGAMSTGLRTAGDFMANLASGAWDTTKDEAQAMKESVQGNSMGGQVSANIDAERTENKVKWAADKGKEGGGDSGGSASPTGGGDNVGDDGGGSSGGGGATPPPLPGSDSPSSVSADAGASAGSGGEAGPVDWGGAVSGGMSKPDADAWQAAIDNHDPSKVGLPDDK